MLDIKFLREHKEEAIKKLLKRQIPKKFVTDLLDLDNKKRQLIKKVEDIKAKKNKFNQEINKLDKDEKKKKIIVMSELTKKEMDIDKQLTATKDKYIKLLDNLPNLPFDDVKTGQNEKENTVINKVGKIPEFNFKPKDYMTLAKTHDLIDTERAAKISGSRFGFLKKEGALMWSALVQYSLNIILKEKFIPFYSPVLVKEKAMKDSGYNSYVDGQEAYYIKKDKLFLVGTGEHALLPYHSNEILSEKNLPLYYTTYSTCFRREAGSYGKDTKGILRVHQFDKQEMLIITTPENSWKEFDHLLKIQEKIIQGLELPYQLLSVCTGDLPKPSAKVVDLECWLPSENKYRETHSASNCTDYQARRNNIRYRHSDGKNYMVHILNGTAITPRVLIAILENGQRQDGSIKIPQVLQPYCHIKKIK